MRVAAALGLALALTGTAQGATYRVGSASGSCTAPTHATLASALAAAGAAGSSHVVEVCPGSYSGGSLVLNQAGHVGLTLRSTSGVAADVVLSASSCSLALVQPERSGITLQALTLRTTLSGCDGVRADVAAQLTLRDLVIESAARGAVVVGSSPGLVLERLNIRSTSHGVEIGSSGDTLAVNGLTVVATAGDGIRATGRTAGSSFTDLNLTASGIGLYLADVLNAELRVSSLAVNRIQAGTTGILMFGNSGTFKVLDTEVENGSSTSHHGLEALGTNTGAWEVKRFKARSAGDGINARGGNGAQLLDLDIVAGGDAVHLRSAPNPVIGVERRAFNVLRASANGISLTDSSAGEFVVRDNFINAGSSSSHAGVNVAVASGAWQMLRNTVEWVGGTGLFITAGGSGGSVRDNQVLTAGVRALRVFTFGQVGSTTVSGNCFYASAYNEDQDGRYTLNGRGNFWGNASGTGHSETCADANADGLCDTPFTVPGFPTRVDSAPLKIAPNTCGVVRLNHIRLEHATGVGLTCTPTVLTLRACADATCNTAYTEGVVVNLTGSLAGTLFPDGSSLTLPPGTSQMDVRVQVPTVASSQLQLASSTPTAIEPMQCNFGAPQCTLRSDAAGLLLQASAHRAESASTLRVSAVRQADNALACVPAFRNVSRTVRYGCGYMDPASGSWSVRLGGTGLNDSGSSTAACGFRDISTAFDTNGEAELPLLYADVGRLALTAQYTGSAGTNDTGLVMNGSTQVVVAPASVVFSNLPTALLTAGADFGLTVTGRNTANAAAPNFGRESAPLSFGWQRLTPSGTGAVDGLFTAGTTVFTAGVGSVSGMRWSEVGSGRLSYATGADGYLGSGQAVSVSTVLPAFKPDRFLMSTQLGCGTFAYAGQNSRLTVRALNALGVSTLNYDGLLDSPHARLVQLSAAAAPGAGTLEPAQIAASAFRAGVAELDLTYRFSQKETPAGDLQLHASDADAVESVSADEPRMPLRSGRVRLHSGIGVAGSPLNLHWRLEYRRQQSWVLSADDSCTQPTLAPWSAALARSGYQDAKGVATAPWPLNVQAVSLNQGVGQLQLAAPGRAGSVDIALNLGATATDRACLPAPRPSTTGLNLPWLRSRLGSTHGCGAREDSDPSARATFGAPPGYSQGKVHERVID